MTDLTSLCRLTTKHDPKLNLVIPAELKAALEAMAQTNGRSVKEEVLARLITTLEKQETFMSHDRLMRLIFCKKLAYRGRQ